jgi:tRNA-Thr(GGU) m(6)t(6)A37 methyltransferase TsaA
MLVNRIEMNPIGIIHTEFTKKAGIPIQSFGGMDYKGTIELKPEFTEGLKDIDGFSHLHLLYFFDQHNSYDMLVTPYMDTVKRGLFATRAPKRPNGIGLSLVELVSVEKNIIHFRGVDMLDKTPLLDIKPYFTDFDSRVDARCGWLDTVKKRNIISDDRF